MQTGGCPHTAIRDDITANLDAIDDLIAAQRPTLDLILVESGGDNLTATFSSGLVDVQIFVIDVAGGDKVPRKGGPGRDVLGSAGDQQDRPRPDGRRRPRRDAPRRGHGARRPALRADLADRRPDGGAGARLGARAAARPAQSGLRCISEVADRRAAGPRRRASSARAGWPRAAPTPTPCIWCRRRRRRWAATPSACGWWSRPAPGCGCAASRRRWRCRAPATTESRAELGPGGGRRARPRPAADDRGGRRAARHVDAADPVRRRAGSGCANGSRSAEPMSGKASGRARCTPTSTGRRCCGTASNWAPGRRPTTSSARRGPASANCAIPRRHVDADRATVLELAAGGCLATWQGERL